LTFLLTLRLGERLFSRKAAKIAKFFCFGFLGGFAPLREIFFAKITKKKGELGYSTIAVR
jgi:hypothetical protein